MAKTGTIVAAPRTPIQRARDDSATQLSVEAADGDELGAAIAASPAAAKYPGLAQTALRFRWSLETFEAKAASISAR